MADKQTYYDKYVIKIAKDLAANVGSDKWSDFISKADDIAKRHKEQGMSDYELWAGHAKDFSGKPAEARNKDEDKTRKDIGAGKNTRLQ